MKHAFSFLMMALLAAFVTSTVFAEDAKPAERKTLKILSIGNSFSMNAHKYLPEVIANAGLDDAVLGDAAIGGCPFKLHWAEIEYCDKDPERKKSYLERTAKVENGQFTRVNGPNRLTLREYLAAEKWDIVTIQSVSHQSYKPETWQPYADNLIAFIHEQAPQAKVMIHRTWAYRGDHPFFHKNDGFTPEKMYELSGEAYAALSKKHNAPMIPAGEAMWIGYQEDPNKQPYPNPKTVRETYKHPDRPSSEGMLIGQYSWAENKNKKGYTLRLDGIHANKRGEYLLACTWYAYLFQRKLDTLTWAPEGIDPEDAKYLRSIAEKVAFQAIERDKKDAEERAAANK